MKISIFFSIGFLLWSAQASPGQERISSNQTVSRTIEAGKTALFSISLNDGDYVNVSLGHHGRINFFLLNTDYPKSIHLPVKRVFIFA